MMKLRWLVGVMVIAAAVTMAGCSSAGAGTSAVGGEESEQSGVAAPITSLSGSVTVNPSLGTLIGCTIEMMLVAPPSSFPTLGSASAASDGSFTFSLPTPLAGDLWPIEDFPFARLLDPAAVTGITISDATAEFAYSQSLPTTCQYSTSVAGPIASSGNTVGVNGDSSIQEIWIYATKDVTLSGMGTATGLDGSGPATKSYDVTVDIVLVSGWNRLSVTKVDDGTYEWYSGPRNAEVTWLTS